MCLHFYTVAIIGLFAEAGNGCSSTMATCMILSKCCKSREPDWFLGFFSSQLCELLRFVFSVWLEQLIWTLPCGHISHFPVWAGDEGPAWGDSQLPGWFSPPALLIFLPVVLGPFCLFTLIKDPFPALLLNKSFFGSFNHSYGSPVICSLSWASCLFLWRSRYKEFKHFSQCSSCALFMVI